MKNFTTKTLAALGLTFALALGQAYAMDHSKMGHDMGAMDEAKKTDHSGHTGVLIKESKLEKGVFSYHLIDNEAQMEKAMKTGGMAMDHSKMEMKPNHLMVYPVGTDSKVIRGAKIGFMITGPGKEVQQVMAMEMGDGYGADLSLKAAGKYEVKMKLVKGDLQVVDTFTYEAK